MAKKIINAFNSGEVSPFLYARTDNESYDSACLKMENFLPLEYGGATRRPSGKFFASSSSFSILHKFVYNKENVYLLSFSEYKLDIYREGADIDNTYEEDTEEYLITTLTTPFPTATLEKLKFVQANNVLFISSEDYAIQVLSRITNEIFELNELEFQYPPTTEETTKINIKADAISGNTTIRSEEPYFTEDMVGQTLILKQQRDQTNSYLSEEVGKAGKSSFSSSINVSFSNYTIETSGTGWQGKVVVEKSIDGGASFEPEYVLIDNSSGKETKSSTIATKHNIATFSTPFAEGANTFIRVHFQSLEAGEDEADGVQIKIKVDDIYIKGIFKITSVDTTNSERSTSAEGVFISPLQDTEANYTGQIWANNVVYKRGAKVFFNGSFSRVADYGGSEDATKELPTGGGDDADNVIDMTYDYINNAFYFLTNNDKVIKYDYDKATETLTYVAKRSLTYSDQYTGIATGRGTLENQSHFGIAFHSDGTYNQKLFVVMRDQRFGGNTSGTTHLARGSRIRIKYFDIFSTDDDQTSATDLVVFDSNKYRATYNVHGLSFGNNRFYFKAHESWKTTKFTQAVTRYSVSLDGNITSNTTASLGRPSLGYTGGGFAALLASIASFFGKSPKTSSNGEFYTYDYRLMEQNDSDNNDIMRRDSMDSIFMDGFVLSLNDDENKLDFRTTDGAFTGRTLDISSKKYFGMAGVPKIKTLGTDILKKGNVYKIISLGTNSSAQNYHDWTEVTGITYTGDNIPAVGDTFTAINDGINNVNFHNENTDGTFELAAESINNASSYDLDVILLNNTNIDTSHNPSGTTELQKYTLQGSSDYYQCIKEHTSNSNFVKDYDTGYWSRRYPNITRVEIGAFSSENGYPRSVSIFENRLCLGGTKKDPNRLWMSQINNFNNFQVGTLDTEALDLRFNSLTQDEIEWLVPSTKLIIGTSENEWALDSGSPMEALTPTQISLKKQSQYGSNNQQGILVNSAVLFFMRQGKKLREWYLQENQQDYLAQDLSFVAEHITGNGIKQMAVQIQPTTIIWMVREDGDLIGLTYERETNTYAWHKHTFDGTVESVAVLPQLDGEDEVFISVKRDTNDNRNILKLDPHNWGTDHITEYSGLDHYVKEEVANLDLDTDFSTVADGLYTSTTTQGDWSITISTSDPTVSSGGDVTFSGSQVTIDGDPKEENAQISLNNVLDDSKTYELTYTVIETIANPITIQGVAGSIGSSGTGYKIQTNSNYFLLKEEVGTHTVKFTPISGGSHFIIAATNYANVGSHQTIEIVSFKDVTNANVISGLDHLDGKTVTVVDNGVKDSNTYTVSSGSITRSGDDAKNGNIKYVGLPYTSTLAPLYVDAQGTQGSKKSIQHAVIRFKDTLKAKVGQKEDALDSVRFTSRSTSTNTYPTPTSLQTNDFEAWLANHNEFLQTVYVVQDEPSPCTVLAMVVDVEGV